MFLFPNSTISKHHLKHTISVSHSLDPDHAPHIVRLDLGPNCLQCLSTDDTSRQTSAVLSQTLLIYQIVRKCQPDFNQSISYL